MSTPSTPLIEVRDLTKHFGHTPFLIGGENWQPILLGATTLFCLWLILLWMYRNRYFVKI